MKKIYSFLCLSLIAGFSFAQTVDVVLQVDVTDYLAGGATLAAGGIRIAGNFADKGATLFDGTPMVNWTPTDATGAMTDLGSNIWTIVIAYPADSAGATQLYKFVNGDWGMNEGTDVANTIATDGCGLDDGGGNINRTLTVPAQPEGYQYCWDHCFRCDLSDPEITAVNNHPILFNHVVLSPNPTNSVAVVSYQLVNSNTVTLDIYNTMGQIVQNVTEEFQAAGVHTITCNISSLPAGNYIYRLNVGTEVTTGNIIKQ